MKFGALQPRDEETSNQIFALEQYVLPFDLVPSTAYKHQLYETNSFDSESSLARHRTSVPFHDMLSWLQNALPNGIHPVPVPLPLQLMRCSSVRPTANTTKDPWILVTQIVFDAEEFSDIEAGLSTRCLQRQAEF